MFKLLSSCSLMSMLMLMLALLLSSLHAILVVASESSIGNVYVHELLREVVSEYSGHHKNYRIEEVSTNNVFNSGYFSIKVHPDLTCHGVAEEYATALNTCTFEGYDSDNNVMMYKFRNMTVYDDASVSLVKVYYSDVACSDYSSESIINVPGCAVVNGRSYQFTYLESKSIFAVDGVFFETKPTANDCYSNASIVPRYSYIPLNTCLTRDEYTFHIFSNCHRTVNGSIAYMESFYGDAACTQVIYNGYTESYEQSDTCVAPGSAPVSVISDEQSRAICLRGVPTSAPTFQPTISLMPTAIPTMRPTAPTPRPSVAPTSVSQFKTNSPTSQPTLAPVTTVLWSATLKDGYSSCTPLVISSYDSSFNRSSLFSGAKSSGFCTLFTSYSTCGSDRVTHNCFPTCLAGLSPALKCSSLSMLALTCGNHVDAADVNLTRYIRDVNDCLSDVKGSNLTQYSDNTLDIKFSFNLVVSSPSLSIEQDLASVYALRASIAAVVPGYKNIALQFADMTTTNAGFLRLRDSSKTIRVTAIVTVYIDFSQVNSSRKLYSEVSASLLSDVESSFSSGAFLISLSSAVTTWNPSILTSAAITLSANTLSSTLVTDDGYGVPTVLPSSQPTGYPSFGGIVDPAIPQAVHSRIPVALISGITVGGAFLIGILSLVGYYVSNREIKEPIIHSDDDQEIANLARSPDCEMGENSSHEVEPCPDEIPSDALKLTKEDELADLMEESKKDISESGTDLTRNVETTSSQQTSVVKTSILDNLRATRATVVQYFKSYLHRVPPAAPDVAQTIDDIGETQAIVPDGNSVAGVQPNTEPVSGITGLLTQIRRNSKNSGRVSPLPSFIEESVVGHVVDTVTDSDYHKVHPLTEIGVGELAAKSSEPVRRPSTSAVTPEIAAAYRRGSFRLNQVLPHLVGAGISPIEAQTVPPKVGAIEDTVAGTDVKVPPAESSRMKQELMDQLRSRPAISRRQTTAATEQTSAFATKTSAKLPKSSIISPGISSTSIGLPDSTTARVSEIRSEQTWSAYAGATSITPDYLRRKSVSKPRASPEPSRRNSIGSKKLSERDDDKDSLGVFDLDGSGSVQVSILKFGEDAFDEVPASSSIRADDSIASHLADVDEEVIRPRTGGFVNSLDALGGGSLDNIGTGESENVVQKFEPDPPSQPSSPAAKSAGEVLLPSAIVSKQKSLGEDVKIGRRTLVLGVREEASEFSGSDGGSDLWSDVESVEDDDFDESESLFGNSGAGHRRTVRQARRTHRQSKRQSPGQSNPAAVSSVALPHTSGDTDTVPVNISDRPSSAQARPTTALAVSTSSPIESGTPRPRSAAAESISSPIRGSSSKSKILSPGNWDVSIEDSVGSLGDSAKLNTWVDSSVETSSQSYLSGTTQTAENNVLHIDTNLNEDVGSIKSYDAAIEAANQVLELSLELKRKEADAKRATMIDKSLENGSKRSTRPSYLQPTTGSKVRASVVVVNTDLAGTNTSGSEAAISLSKTAPGQPQPHKSGSRVPPGGAEAIISTPVVGEEKVGARANSQSPAGRKRTETTVRKMNAIQQKKYDMLAAKQQKSDSESEYVDTTRQKRTTVRVADGPHNGGRQSILKKTAASSEAKSAVAHANPSIVESDSEYDTDQLEMSSIASSTTGANSHGKGGINVRSTTVVRKLKGVKKKRLEMLTSAYGHH